MQNDIIIKISKLLGTEELSGSDVENYTSLAVKLQSIIESDDAKQRQDTVSAIQAFLEGDVTNKRKLLSYCLDFFDPTVQSKTISQSGEEIQQHAYLKHDELYLLHQFVKRHQSDISFGETVYKIMDKHGMTAPQVYKNALLRRQDFARVTDPRCKNVTRKMAWQIVIGLHCSLEEADDILFSAGYIRRNTRLDLTMQYFIEHENYDIEAIDAVLSELGLKTFTCE